jgi:hypothetical protein
MRYSMHVYACRLEESEEVRAWRVCYSILEWYSFSSEVIYDCVTCSI